MTLHLSAVVLTLSLIAAAIGCQRDARESYTFLLPDELRGWVWIGESREGGQKKRLGDDGRVLIIVPSTGVADVAYMLDTGVGLDSFRTTAGRILPTLPRANETGVRARGSTRFEKNGVSISGETFFIGTEKELPAAKDKAVFVEEVWHSYRP